MTILYWKPIVQKETVLSEQFIKIDAREDFQKARMKAMFTNMLGILKPQRQNLLSFEEVKNLLHPDNQSYKGLQTVDVKLVIGSEDRYQDFNKHFQPRHDYLEHRWTRVDEAHLSNVTLPPIKLYEIGGVYFVRDGNHRVSVAHSQGVEQIDAEVISLGTKIIIDPDSSIEALYRKVLEYERKDFFDQTGLDKLFPDFPFECTGTGQYEEIVSHIFVHKYFINQELAKELPLDDAVRSWFENVFEPIVHMVQNDGLLLRFPGRTNVDLYVLIVKHWHYLKEKYGPSVTAREAAESYSRLFGVSYRKRMSKKAATVLKLVTSLPIIKQILHMVKKTQ